MLRSIIFVVMWTALSATSAQAADSMIGLWENHTNGDITGLALKDQEHCEIYLERALQRRSTRACKYEAFQDRFLIFMINEHGLCNSEADFEFIFEAAAPLVRLVIGGSEMILQKTATAQ